MSNFKYDLTVALITKNEIKYIEKCLKALLPLKDIISCEIIVTDTGSTDGTVEIAKKYADKFLTFEWCDDFAKARNTGVDASEGRWFMYLDADDIFDETIVEVAEFIKSGISKKYNSATYRIKNYLREDSDIGNEYQGARICNNEKKKIYFIGKIHEQLNIENCVICDLSAKSHHYGYIDTAVKQKQDRNRILLEQEHEENPNDLRIISHLLDCYSNNQKKAEFALKGIEIAKKTNQTQSLNTNVLYTNLCMAYYSQKDYNAVIENALEILQFTKKNTLPQLEVLYYITVSYLRTFDLNNTIKYFTKYQDEYKYLKNNNDYVYELLLVSNSITSNVYAELCFEIVTALISKNDFANAEKILSKNTLKDYDYLNYSMSGIFKYMELASNFNNDNLLKDLPKFFMNLKTQKQEILFMKDMNNLLFISDDNKKSMLLKCFNIKSSNYFIAFNHLRANNYNASLCSPEIINAIKSNNNIYELDIFSDLLYATLKYSFDIFDLFKNCSFDYLKDLTLKIIEEHEDFMEIIYNSINENKILNVLPIHKLFNCYLSNTYITTKCQQFDYSNKVNKNELEKLERVFTFLVNTSNEYVTEMFSKEIPEDDLLKILPDYQAFGFAIYDTFKNQKSAPIEYIKDIKNNIKYCVSLSQCTSILTTSLQDNLSCENTNNVNTNPEFQKLARKFKQVIRNCIRGGKKRDALSTLEQYKAVNPTDPEINELLNAINSIN